MASHPSPLPVDEAWRAGGAGEHYDRRRFRTARAAHRDPRLVARLLAQHGRKPEGSRVLDVPSGTGRLRSTLQSCGGKVLGVDVSRAMLDQDVGWRVQASAWALPFADDSFATVVCCRLLHHVAEPERRLGLVRELVRVSSDLVLASFWDAASLHAWRRRLGPRRGRHPDRRTAVALQVLRAEFEAAGSEVLEVRHSLRFVSSQAFLAARKRG